MPLQPAVHLVINEEWANIALGCSYSDSAEDSMDIDQRKVLITDGPTTLCTKEWPCPLATSS